MRDYAEVLVKDDDPEIWPLLKQGALSPHLIPRAKAIAEADGLQIIGVRINGFARIYTIAEFEAHQIVARAGHDDETAEAHR